MFILPPDDAMDLLAKARSYGELDEMEAKQLLHELGMDSPSTVSRIAGKMTSYLSHLFVSVANRREQHGADKSVGQSDRASYCCEGELP